MKKGLSWLYNFFTNTYSELSMLLGDGYALPPIHAFFEITYNCNQRCQMCYFLKMLENPKERAGKKELTFQEIRRIINQMPSFALITITGGEPLIRKDSLEIIEYVSKRNKCNIISNGSLIDEVKAKKLIELGSKYFFTSGLVAIGISIDGVGEKHDDFVRLPGAYEKAMNGIQYLAEEKKRQNKKFPFISLQTVVNKYNYEEIPELARQASQRGINIINLLTENPRADMNRMKIHEPDMRWVPAEKVEEIPEAELMKMLDELKKTANEYNVEFRFSPFSVPEYEKIKHYQNDVDMKNYMCRGVFCRVMVTAYGEAIHCLNGYLGDLRRERLSDVLNNKKFRDFRMAVQKAKVFPRCVGCCLLEYVGK